MIAASVMRCCSLMAKLCPIFVEGLFQFLFVHLYAVGGAAEVLDVFTEAGVGLAEMIICKGTGPADPW